MSTHDAFSAIAVRYADGSRDLHPYSRFLGIRDGYLFLEDGVATDRAGMGIKTAQTHAIALAEVARVDIETGEDDDENSETSLALEGAGMLNYDGSVYLG